MDFRIVKFLLVCLQIIIVQSVENVSLEEKSVTTTIKTTIRDIPNSVIEVTTTDQIISYNTTDLENNQRNITEDEETKSEIDFIFNDQNSFNGSENYSDVTNLKDNNITAANNTIKPDPQARLSEESEDNSPIIGPGESAGILAGVVVLIGVVGYIGFVVWRRYLQYKYGNSEMLITDDVYDITDLRYFEI